MNQHELKVISNKLRAVENENYDFATMFSDAHKYLRETLADNLLIADENTYQPAEVVDRHHAIALAHSAQARIEDGLFDSALRVMSRAENIKPVLEY